MSTLRKFATLGISVLAVMATDICSSVPLCAQAPAGSPATTASPSGPGGGMGRMPADPKALNAPRTIAPYFTPATSVPKAPDADGFLQRWLLLERSIDYMVRPNQKWTITPVADVGGYNGIAESPFNL